MASALIKQVPPRIGLVVPTKDRPHNVRNLVRSLETSQIKPDICLIVDASLKPLEVASDSFPLFLLRPGIVGQVRQRNYGIKRLSEHEGIDYALILDDDIVLEKDAIGNLMDGVRRFENQDATFVGFSLNITNFRSSTHFVRRLLLHPKRPGSVNSAAINSSLCDLAHDIEVGWVLGGAALWKLKFLKDNPSDYPFRGKAYGEDFYYSSKVRPIAKYAAIAAARCSHDDTYMDAVSPTAMTALKDGQMEASVRIYIAKTFPQYFLPFAVLHIVWVALAGLAFGAISLRKDTFFMSVGRLVGLFRTPPRY